VHYLWEGYTEACLWGLTFNFAGAKPPKPTPVLAPAFASLVKRVLDGGTAERFHDSRDVDKTSLLRSDSATLITKTASLVIGYMKKGKLQPVCCAAETDSAQ
jgi:hypothetical protein